jgi:RimJ/RimL family protein N-acetyltransferase
MPQLLANDLPAVAAADARLSTERLTLTPLTREHAEPLFRVLSDSKLYQYTGGTPPGSADQLRAWYAQLESGRSGDGAELWLNWMLSESASGASIGWIQATVTAHFADIAWIVGTPWQGRGYATEAARALVSWLRRAGATVVRAKVHAAHIASQHVAANAGLSRIAETIEGEDVWIARSTSA